MLILRQDLVTRASFGEDLSRLIHISVEASLQHVGVNDQQLQSLVEQQSIVALTE